MPLDTCYIAVRIEMSIQLYLLLAFPAMWNVPFCFSAQSNLNLKYISRETSPAHLSCLFWIVSLP